MEEIKKTYTQGELTIVWQPAKCIHSTRCWKGLLPVFNPRRKPWVDMSAATAQQIMEQVSMCPSGALSYTVANEAAAVQVAEASIDNATRVEAMKNGPLLVHGSIVVTNSDGTKHRAEKATAFCRCGASANKPFCDGSHKKAGFEG